MLPNWLYGKSKSKLQEILGGGGGGGATYTAGEGIDITNHEISVDPELLSDISLKVSKTQISNPNILHNPWFQVNQRGVTSMTTNGYFVDRWRTYCAQTGSTTFTLNSDGTITIDNSLGESSAYFIQRRTAKTISRVAGRTVTASVMLSDGTVRSGSGIYVTDATKDYYDDPDIKLQSVAQTANQFLLLVVKAGKSITVKALKLELGEVSTLAMDTAPDMATELLKCQRYFIRYTNDTQYSTHTAIGVAQTATNIFVDLILPSQMRAKPALSAPSINIEAPGTATVSGTPTVSFGAALMNNIARLTVTGLTNLTVGSPYYFIINAGSYIDFDAEL